ncbi:MAG: electron transfer flavoprotein subunit alpha [Rhodospirillaceae bacterium]|jgi:electron transfer flavoprotein alpha subunit|nr:electron transfer flavoprotein subunit alpha [Rhodospirillaceae bacterium]|tara:strand:+ start:371 stop:1306 length:936 start_codon:yes stop_codon:yes gene_type:complete
MPVLVYIDHDNQNLNVANLSTITAASMIGEVHAVVVGYNCSDVAKTLAETQNIEKVLIVDSEAYTNPIAENISAVLVSISEGYSHILAPATTVGKNIMPRLSALLDVQQISEIVDVIDSDTFDRPIYAGNAIATVKSNDSIKVITVRTTAFEPASKGSSSVDIFEIEPPEISNHLSEFVGSELTKLDRPELTSARVIISGGRGMQNGENFKLLEKVAELLGAAVGASRAAVDSGFVSNDYQVGQTGKIVAPELYIAVGISGAIQHLAGMKDSKVIVAINKDEDAPIFQVADYGLVADLFEAIPELENELRT